MDMGATEECKDLPGRTYEYCIAQFAAFEGEMTVSFIRRPVLQKGLIQTTTDGQTKPMDFFDKQRMRRIYEKFILEYYRKEHPESKRRRLRFHGISMTVTAKYFLL